MRIFILALLVIAGLLAFDSCAARNDPLGDTARWDAYATQRQFNDQYRPVLDAVSLVWIVLPLALLAGGALVALDAYAQRRKPVIRLDPDAIHMRRDLLSSNEALALQAELARLRQSVHGLAAQHQTPASLNYSPSIHYRNDQTGLVPDMTPAAPGLPAAPSLAQIAAEGFTPTADKMLLGFGAQGAIYGPISALLSTAIAGRPGQGKSNLLKVICWQTIRAGGRVGLLDPHGGILEDASGAPMQFAASTAGELDDAAALLVAELDRRIAAYRRGERGFTPYLALCDELPVLSLSSKPAMQAIGRAVLEGRKVGVYALIAGQGMPAESFNGRLVRDALSSRFVFRTTADEARRCGLAGDNAKLVNELRPGLAVLDGPVDTQIVAIPLATAGDMAALGGADVASAVASTARPFGFQPATNGSHMEAKPEAKNTASQRQTASADARRVAALFLAGSSVPEIVFTLYGLRSSDGGRRYTEARDRVEALLREAMGGG